MRTHRSKIRRLRAYWRLCKPTPAEVVATAAISAIWLAIVILLP